MRLSSETKSNGQKTGPCLFCEPVISALTSYDFESQRQTQKINQTRDNKRGISTADQGESGCLQPSEFLGLNVEWNVEQMISFSSIFSCVRGSDQAEALTYCRYQNDKPANHSCGPVRDSHPLPPVI